MDLSYRFLRLPRAPASAPKDASTEGLSHAAAADALSATWPVVSASSVIEAAAATVADESATPQLGPTQQLRSQCPVVRKDLMEVESRLTGQLHELGTRVGCEHDAVLKKLVDLQVQMEAVLGQSQLLFEEAGRTRLILERRHLSSDVGIDAESSSSPVDVQVAVGGSQMLQAGAPPDTGSVSIPGMDVPSDSWLRTYMHALGDGIEAAAGLRAKTLCDSASASLDASNKTQVSRIQAQMRKSVKRSSSSSSSLEGVTNGYQHPVHWWTKKLMASRASFANAKSLPIYIKVYSGLFIVINSVCLACTEDASMKAALSGQPQPDWIQPMEYIFATLFAIEIAARMRMSFHDFFRGEAKYWNLFDTVLLCSAMLELAVDSSINMSFMRGARIIRFFRIVRVFRLVSELHTMRLMASMISSAIVSLFWAAVFCGMFTFVASIFFMSKLSYQVQHVGMDPGSLEAVRTYYSTFPTTMLSIIACVSGGVDWMDVAEPLGAVGGLTLACFMVYIMFVVFGLMNILTGIVVESTKRVADVDRELVMEEQLENEASLTKALMEIFKAADSEGRGRLNKGDLESHLSNFKVHFFLNSIGVAQRDALQVFRYLEDDEGFAEIDKYVNALVYFQGAAKSIDVALVLSEVRRLSRAVRRSEEEKVEEWKYAFRHARAVASSSLDLEAESARADDADDTGFSGQSRGGSI